MIREWLDKRVRAQAQKAQDHRDRSGGLRSTTVRVYVTREYAPGEQIASISCPLDLHVGDSVDLAFNTAYTDLEFTKACASPELLGELDANGEPIK